MTRIEKISPESLKRAAEMLSAGQLVALPTETVYGLAANALDDGAVQKIYDAKRRPAHNPLILHVMTPEDADKWAHINALARTLIDHFWPGPLTLVLPRSNNSVSKIAGAGLSTIAIRCPSFSWTKALQQAGFSSPIFMPSANRSGHISPTSADHVADDLADRVDLILDGGVCENGIESTVLKIESDHAILLRPGAIPTDAFVPFISDLRLSEKKAALSSPGMLKSHYAPKARMRLNVIKPKKEEAFLAFGKTDIATPFNLSPSGNLAEAARNLYRMLRAMDNVDVIAVAPIPNEGLGEAINDRLKRAAADKDS